MTDLPISFTLEPARDLRAGAFTQLRRPRGILSRLKPGDRLWVREPFHFEPRFDDLAPLQALRLMGDAIVVHHAVDGPSVLQVGIRRTARVMPRRLHRQHLVIAAIRDESLQDLTEADARVEGAAGVADFAARWDRVNAPQMRNITGDAVRWADNPRVTVIAFTRVAAPIVGAR